MNNIDSDCGLSIQNNKCSECNDYFQCALIDYIEERDNMVYERGVKYGIDFVLENVSTDCDCEFINDCGKYNSCNGTFYAKFKELCEI